MNEWIHFDDNEPIFQNLADTEIISTVQGDNSSGTQEKNDEERGNI